MFIPLNISANERVKVTLDKCVDGDTAWFIVDNESKKVRFLAINSPESTTTKEYYGKEASDYTCDILTKATTVEIEYDSNSQKLDKYGRLLGWIFADNELLQSSLVRNGYAKVDYLYGKYTYTSVLHEDQKVAQDNLLGIWNTEAESNFTVEEEKEEESEPTDSEVLYVTLTILGVITISVPVFNSKKIKKFIKKLKR